MKILQKVLGGTIFWLTLYISGKILMKMQSEVANRQADRQTPGKT